MLHNYRRHLFLFLFPLLFGLYLFHILSNCCFITLMTPQTSFPHPFGSNINIEKIMGAWEKRKPTHHYFRWWIKGVHICGYQVFVPSIPPDSELALPIRVLIHAEIHAFPGPSSLSDHGPRHPHREGCRDMRYRTPRTAPA